MSILNIQDLGKSYNGKDWAVQHFGLNVSSERIIALLGESGSGKTTVLRLIAGFEEADHGSIIMHGRLVSSKETHLAPEKRGIGMVFQDYALFPHLSVKDNILYGLFKLKKSEALKKLQEVLELTGLVGMEHRYPHQLSGGQQQRVALARAIAPSPLILLLDEPFSNIDSMMKEDLRNELKDILRKTGITVLFVTHDTQDALSMADEVVLMQHGQVLQTDSPQRIFEQPLSVDVARFFGAVNVVSMRRNGNKWTSAFGAVIQSINNDLEDALLLVIRPQAFIINDDATEDSFVVDIIDNQFYGEYRMLRCVPIGHMQQLIVKVKPSMDQQEGKLHLSIDNESIIVLKTATKNDK